MNPILVEHFRGNIVESFHRGVICVVDKDNKIVYEKGDISQMCYPRSAMKYFQHIPLLTSGVFENMGFTEKDLAVMCGSHNGEKIHQDQVSQILEKSGLTTQFLKCGPQAPALKKDYINLIKSGEVPKDIHNNCSGKHAGFLAYCQSKNLNTETYLNADHPLQKEIKEVISLIYEFPLDKLENGMDGCSAPTYGMPVYNQAIAFKNLVYENPNYDQKLIDACRLIVKSVSDFPEMVAGTDRYCTDIMRITQGRIIGKTGADGVYCLSVPDKNWGISIKIDDGKMGPQYIVAQELLLHLNLISQQEADDLIKYHEIELKNFAGNTVGKSRAVNIRQ